MSVQQFLMTCLKWTAQSGLTAVLGTIIGIAAIVIPIFAIWWLQWRLRYLAGFISTFRAFPYAPGEKTLEFLRARINETLRQRAEDLKQVEDDLESADGYWQTVYWSVIVRWANQRFSRTLELARLFKRMEVVFRTPQEYVARKYEKT